ncbi:DUF362 domain-containing protein [Leptolyngbya sp. FACHB-261]|uniref:DUF362 domain-containing protein n=1 Tax=Leptolyngbya sp. FACHB-261 TaxID=2692806 RepID=UPI001688FBB0|nr:DUF362 domain-containing protein [Leptolyngbya sp. FACHB-261]MBD2103841.1 DUF362 domain-containing protein [Leptolyngbya sp. FACHB-261]
MLSDLYPLVSLHRSTTYHLPQLQQDLEQLLQPMGGLAAVVKPGDRVLLKPNLLTGSRPGRECITRPEIVQCLTVMVRDCGGKPFLGDSPAFGSARGVARANGLLAVAKALELPIIEFHGRRYQTVSETFDHLRLSSEAMEADVVINLPKVKSHGQLTLTLGVKNLFGCVPGKMKAWWHLEAGKDSARFAEMLVETARAINPRLTILDGIIAHEGNGPSNGKPRSLGLLAASTDVFTLDRVFTEILGVELLQVPTVAASIHLGLCPSLNSQIQVVGPDLEALKITDWQLPDHMVPLDFGLPRILQSTFRHLYIRFIQEPMTAYTNRVS